MVTLLIRDREGRKTVVASADLQVAVNAMLVAVSNHMEGVSPSLH